MIETLRARDRTAVRVTKKLIRAATPAVGDLVAGEDEIVDGVIALGAAQTEITRFLAGTNTQRR
jgi:hypothetical protein